MEPSEDARSAVPPAQRSMTSAEKPAGRAAAAAASDIFRASGPAAAKAIGGSQGASGPSGPGRAAAAAASDRLSQHVAGPASSPHPQTLAMSAAADKSDVEHKTTSSADALTAAAAEAASSSPPASTSMHDTAGMSAHGDAYDFGVPDSQTQSLAGSHEEAASAAVPKATGLHENAAAADGSSSNAHADGDDCRSLPFGQSSPFSADEFPFGANAAGQHALPAFTNPAGLDTAGDSGNSFFAGTVEESRGEDSFFNNLSGSPPSVPPPPPPPCGAVNA